MLNQQRFLFLDCQTTGMHPSSGELLEIAWCLTSAEELLAGAEPQISSYLIETGRPLPWRVQEITGLRPADFEDAVPLDEARENFLSAIGGTDDLWAVIHYAQLTRPSCNSFYLERLAKTLRLCHLACFART